MTSNARARAAYAVLVVVLFAAQAAVTWAGLEGLRYEELADFIRNPFWFDHRLVYDGASANNVAWYALLLLTYKTLGFSPYASKYLRLALQALSLVCAALLARRWVGDRRGWLPLVAYGLSPTALYFNSFAFGIDLQMFPVVVWLITRLHGTLAEFAVGCLAMLTCLSYSSFVLYVPALVVLYIWLNRAAPAGQIVRGLAIAGAGFAAPFVAALAYLRNSGTFLTDPSVGGAGVFRGGATAMTLDPIGMARAMSQVLQDLFVHGSSYYFELPHVEFSGLLGVAAAWGLLIGALVVGWNWRAARAPLVLAAALCVISLVVPLLSQHLPGLRRSTGFLAGTYIVLACVWAAPIPAGVRAAAVWLGKMACVLLVVHHVIVFAPNRRFVHEQVRTIQDPWFNRYGTPAESIDVWTRDWVMQGRPLMCPAPGPCRYSEIYAALAGHMKWNGLGDHPIVVVDPRTGAVTTLDIAAFQSRTIAP